MHYQLFPALEPATEAALRASIQRFGVLVPVTVDQHGNVLDGHHRKRIAEELGVECDIRVRRVRNEDEANEIARTLNMDRRHLSTEDRRRMVEALRSEGHSMGAIAGALGVTKSAVQRDLSIVSADTMPDRVRTSDGRSYPASREPKQEAERRADEIRSTLQRLDDLADDDPDPASPFWCDNCQTDTGKCECESAALDYDYEEKPWKAVYEAKWAAEETKPAPTPRAPMAVPKKTVAEGIPPHPATYPEAIIAIFREAIPSGSRVLDPFAGVGTIHQLRPDIETHGIEIEAKWAAANPLTVVGNSRNAHNIFAGQTFDTIATSPAYGNRLADSYKASDPHARHSYSIDLGQPLETDNGGGLHFATDGRYEELHQAVWDSVVSLLKPGGLFLLNCKDFKRDGQIMRPTAWHIRTLAELGLTVVDLWTLPAKGLAFTNAEPMSELVIALEK